MRRREILSEHNLKKARAECGLRKFSLLLVDDLHNHITKNASDMISENKTND